MFGSIRHVFASRWKALWWACGVLLTAYCSIPSADQDAAKLAAAKHVNPWAKGYHDQAAQPKSESMDLREMLKRAQESQQQSGEHENPWAKKPDQQKS